MSVKTKLETTVHDARYRAYCECGRMAVRKSLGDWCCERCAFIQENRKSIDKKATGKRSHGQGWPMYERSVRKGWKYFWESRGVSAPITAWEYVEY